ncbi:MAG: RNA polymerase factor sigma-54 [Parachlamydia sp.]|jgi:RNA polymerase sigma-54 factor|nr:RNA polymerase factor sigma-54 [Parachlamydia sp.]
MENGKNTLAAMQVLQPNLQLTQRLMMSAQMQQALHLLQVPLLELEPFIEEQVSLNPLLEMEGEEAGEELLPEGEEEKDIELSDKDLSILSRLDEEFADHFNSSDSYTERTAEEEKKQAYREQLIVSKSTLREHLHQQAREIFDEASDRQAAEILIDYLDEKGFLTTPLEEISLIHQVSVEQLKNCLDEIRTFEPYGVGAATIQESLLIQLKCLKKAGTLAYELVENHYDDLLHNHLPQIQKKIKCTFEEIQEAIHAIALLDLHPGMHYTRNPVQPIIPDVTIKLENDQLVVQVDRETAPQLKLNRRYLNMLLDDSVPQETKRYIKQNMFSAKWLVRNLQQRYSTIERIAGSLVEKQHEFFLNPDGELKPLTMKIVAEELELNESTVARTVANKYIDTPRGLYPLRSFFTTKYLSEEGEELSAQTIKDAIRELIEKENKQKPYSDEKLSLMLKEKGLNCARRTIAKHRAALEFGTAQQRRKYV